MLQAFQLFLLVSVFPQGKADCTSDSSCPLRGPTLVQKRKSTSREADGASKEAENIAMQKGGSAVTKSLDKGQIQVSSLALSRRFALAANAVVPGATRELLNSFRVCSQCDQFKRFGEANDGGYLTCMTGLTKEKIHAAYSVGVEQHDKWSQDVVDTVGIAVNQFDCTVSGSNCKGCQFIKKCIVAADGQHPVPGHESESVTLENALELTDHARAADGSLLMKMDTEGSEWPLFDLEKPDLLKKFGQLIVEFHNLEKEEHHDMYLAALKNIEASGLMVSHLHGNNYQGMYEVGKQTIPKVLEVTFIRSGEVDCAAQQLYSTLDAPNNPSGPELPLAQMPP